MSGNRAGAAAWIAGGLCVLTVVFIVISVPLNLLGLQKELPVQGGRAPAGRRRAANGGGRRAHRCPPAG
jgi:hypothetical protein